MRLQPIIQTILFCVDKNDKNIFFKFVKKNIRVIFYHSGDEKAYINWLTFGHFKWPQRSL